MSEVPLYATENPRLEFRFKKYPREEPNGSNSSGEITVKQVP